MEILLNNLETIESTRRDLLKYSAFCISSLAGINALQSGLQLPIKSPEPAISSTIVDYTTKPYNVFLISENIHQVNKLLLNARVENIYVYSHTITSNTSNKVIVNNTLQNLLNSLGSIIPFDFDITSLDIKSWKVREAFLYISEAYANIQNNSTVSLNEEKLLSSLNTIGLYNKNIYIANTSAWLIEEIKYINLNAFPIGDLISL